MGKRTDYKRLWRREQGEVTKLGKKITALEQINEAQIEVLKRVRDGEIDPKDILKGEGFKK